MEETLNKKLIVTVGLLVLAVAFVGVSVVSAQTPVPPAQPTPTPAGNSYGYGYGMIGGGYGMMGGYGMTPALAPGASVGGGRFNGTRYGPMHDAMFNALAEGLGITREELDKRVLAGETPAQIAASLGFSQADFISLMTEARKAAMTEAVAQGYLTQAQSDWMLNRMGRFGGVCPHFAATPNP